MCPTPFRLRTNSRGCGGRGETLHPDVQGLRPSRATPVVAMAGPFLSPLPGDLLSEYMFGRRRQVRLTVGSVRGTQGGAGSSLKRGGILRLVTVQRFGHVWSRDHTTCMVFCALLCVCRQCAVRLGDVRDFMIRLLMIGNTAQRAYCTVYLLHSVPTEQCAYCTACLLHSVPTAQCAYCTVYLLHSVLLHGVPTARCAYCTVYLLHNVPTARCAYCTV
jgi:hypothetical protein